MMPKKKCFRCLLLLSLVVPFAWTGCRTGQVEPPASPVAVTRTSAESVGSGLDPVDVDKSRLAELFGDTPAYSALVDRSQEDATLPRLRSSVAPKYPLGAGSLNPKAIVRVAFVVSETGAVEDARVYEATDDRFSAAALDSVRRWSFHPGTRNGAPAKFLLVVPVRFDGRR